MIFCKHLKLVISYLIILIFCFDPKYIIILYLNFNNDFLSYDLKNYVYVYMFCHKFHILEFPV